MRDEKETWGKDLKEVRSEVNECLRLQDGV